MIWWAVPTLQLPPYSFRIYSFHIWWAVPTLHLRPLHSLLLPDAEVGEDLSQQVLGCDLTRHHPKGA